MRATLKIILRKNYLGKTGKQPIGLQYTAYRQTTYIGLDISVKPEHWSDSKKMILVGEKYHLQYNRIIREQHHKAEQIIFDNFLKPLSTKDFVNKFKDRYYDNKDFYVFVESELEFLKLSRAQSTINNYCSLINKMKVWKPSLLFNEISLEFIQRFHQFEVESGNEPPTIYKKHANLKFLLGLAIDKELIKKNPYDKFKIKRFSKGENMDILTEEELQLLQQVYNSGKYSKYKQESLRCLLFGCYTSLSYAEFQKVLHNNLKVITLNKKEVGETYYLLSNDRQKTRILYKIPIVSPTVKSLLEMENKKSFQKIFFPLSNNTINRYLKKIIKEAGINKTITLHRARHTFRTIAAKKGIRDSIAERIMGHASRDSIQDIYMHLSDEDIVMEMRDRWIV
ncbi:site-specific integrase [Dysgonomonas capnocytophagoides]|uniref:site-specific integrase n=1 Tax=Dysgonomonas capnocytophagoides TaxID=45254 RepID=UPI00291CA96E|nr:site-specific integrase [Dysgonomonas capnocytophagoides]